MDGKPRVAFVDDDPRLRSLIAEELSDEGVQPLACSTGQELLDCLDVENVDLILLSHDACPGRSHLPSASQSAIRKDSDPCCYFVQ